MFDKFSDRHIGVTNPEDLKAMLAVIGVKSVDELIAQVIPQSIRLKQPLALPQGMSEYEFANHIQALAAKNRTLRSFIGMGYYPCAVPAAITRNVFENPAWYTSYTPYQAEISQGRLEALLNFQTAVISLTGMEIGNCSLLDEGTAAAEAMLMMFSLRSREAVKEGRNQLFVDRNIFPQTLDVLITRSEPFGIELVIDDYNTYEFTGKEFGAIVQRETDAVGTEITPERINELFHQEYVDVKEPYKLLKHAFQENVDADGHSHVTFRGTLQHTDTIFNVSGEGNGPIDAFFNAIKGEKMARFSFLDYTSHAITDGSDSQGVAYILLRDQRDGKEYWGVGLSHNINLAPLRGILSAINRAKRARYHE